MIQISVNNVPVLFSKFFSSEVAQEAMGAVKAVNAKTVLLLDTPATPALPELIEGLKALESVEAVIVRDHHGVTEPTNERETDLYNRVNEIRQLVDEGSVFSTREAHPSCPALVELGEFAGTGGLFIIADPDVDGLMTAMRAMGIEYAEMLADADVMDGPHELKNADNLSEYALLLVKGLVTVPAYNPKYPGPNESAKANLFSWFVTMVQGIQARIQMQAKVAEYEAAVARAEDLAKGATQLAEGVYLADVRDAGNYDLTVFTKVLATRGAKVTVVQRNDGPINNVGGHEVQYSLAVIDAHQVKELGAEGINLSGFVPVVEGEFKDKAKAGVISNTDFLLHVSGTVWEQTVLPALVEKFGTVQIAGPAETTAEETQPEEGEES